MTQHDTDLNNEIPTDSGELDIPRPASQAARVMSHAFVRKFLPDVVEKHLREAIARGDYGPALPGERVLAEILKVSRPTLRRALATLSAEGLIRQRPGHPTEIIAKPAPETPAETKMTGRVVLMSSHPLHQLSPGTIHLVDQLENTLTHLGLDLHFNACHAFREHRFETSLTRFLRSAPADVYVLHQAPPKIQRHLASLGLPCVIMGTPDPAAGLPGVDTDFSPAVRHAMGELKRLGHRPDRVRLILPEVQRMGHLAMREGFLSAGGEESDILLHSEDFETLPAWIATHFIPLLRGESAPTAVITSWSGFTVPLVSPLSMRYGMRIPENLSVICLETDPMFDMLIPRITRYRRPTEKFVNHLARLVHDVAKHRDPGKLADVRIEPEFVSGGTLAAPRQERPVL